MERPSWNEYFIDLAVLASSRSTCLRKQHGAIIVRDRQVVSMGYNGTPTKITHCETCFREEHNIPHGTMYELCLHGNTKIKCLDGTYPTIKELSEKKKNVWVYSVDTSTGKLIPALATNPRKTGIRNDLVEIVLDNGVSVILTQDHPVLGRDLVYYEAKNLVPGQSLMPMYYNIQLNGTKQYESISNTTKTRLEGPKHNRNWLGITSNTPTHHWVDQFFNGPRPKKDYLVHHINENSLDNSPNNLQRLSRSEHSSHHDKGFPEEARKKGREKINWLLKNDAVYREKFSEKRSEATKKQWEDASFREYMLPIQRQNGINSMKKRKTDNHKVISIRKINVSCDVYDMTVEGPENFAIELGDNSCIFVHNCRSTHAEANAIVQAAKHGIAIDGAIIYVTGIPCLMCSRLIINAGIKEVITGFDEHEDQMQASIELLKEAGVKWRRV